MDLEEIAIVLSTLVGVGSTMFLSLLVGFLGYIEIQGLFDKFREGNRKKRQKQLDAKLEEITEVLSKLVNGVLLPVDDFGRPVVLLRVIEVRFVRAWDSNWDRADCTNGDLQAVMEWLLWDGTVQVTSLDLFAHRITEQEVLDAPVKDIWDRSSMNFSFPEPPLGWPERS